MSSRHFLKSTLLGSDIAVYPGLGNRLPGLFNGFPQHLANDAPASWPVSVYRSSRSPVPPRIKIVFDSLVSALGRAEEFGP